LSLIDLAGSERASATNNRGARLQEGANINKSLLALANCINALAGNNNGKKVNVKYRDSKLTHLLKSSLEGNCNLVMIANVNPSDSTYEDSHNTLKYSNRAKNIKVNPLVKNSVKESNWLEREISLRDEIKMLRNKVNELELVIVEMKNEKNNNSIDRSVEKITNESEFIEEENNDNDRCDSIGFWNNDNDYQYDECSIQNTSMEINKIIDSSSKKRQLEDNNNNEGNNNEDKIKNNHVSNNVSMLSDSILMAGLFADEEDEESKKIVLNPKKKRRGSMIPSIKGEKLSSIIAPESTIEISNDSFVPRRSSRKSINNQVKVDKPIFEGIRKSSRISMSKDDMQNENSNPNIIIVKSNISNLKASINNNNGRRKSLAVVSALLENIPGQFQNEKNQDLEINTNNMEVKIKGGLKDNNNNDSGGITGFVKRMSNKVVNRKSKSISDENIWIDI
jgi:kinesin family protein 18/19